MTYRKVSNQFLLRLDQDENFFSAMERFVIDSSVQSGKFSGIGSFKNCELGYYNLKNKEYQKQSFPETNEVVNLLGNLSTLSGKPFLHAHVSISDQNFNVKGGHLFAATVGATLEIVFEEFSSDIDRKLNQEIGLNLLDL